MLNAFYSVAHGTCDGGSFVFVSLRPSWIVPREDDPGGFATSDKDRIGDRLRLHLAYLISLEGPTLRGAHRGRRRSAN